MKRHQYFVYIMTNRSNQVLYTGVTNDIERRTYEHKQGVGSKFTNRYNCHKLTYYEEFQWIQEAIAREKQIKAGSRKKKIELIERENPNWKDLSEGWYD